ncbi:MAG: general secretion pathway protein GspK [Micropepsaceae bacterium]
MGERNNERGIALIAVLGFLTVMSLLVLSVTSAVRGSLDASARHLARLQAQAAVDSGIELAVNQLIDGQQLAPPVLDRPQTFEVGGYKVVVSARPESAKIDLNYADVALLMGMFREAGADADRASALASAILDWRDGDDLLHVNGAEEKEYAAAGLKYGPADKPFESVDELRFVLGVTPAMFACLRGEVTVLAQRASVDIDHASPLVRRAAGVTADTPQGSASSFSVISGQAVGAGEVYEITARVDDAKRNIRRGERVAVRITGNRNDPFWTLAVGLAPRTEASCAASAPANGAD